MAAFKLAFKIWINGKYRSQTSRSHTHFGSPLYFCIQTGVRVLFLILKNLFWKLNRFRLKNNGSFTHLQSLASVILHFTNRTNTRIEGRNMNIINSSDRNLRYHWEFTQRCSQTFNKTVYRFQWRIRTISEEFNCTQVYSSIDGSRCFHGDADSAVLLWASKTFSSKYTCNETARRNQ